MKQRENHDKHQQDTADSSILRLAEVLGLEHWAVAEPPNKVAVVRAECDAGGYWQKVSLSHDAIIRGTYDNWHKMLKDSTLSVENAMRQQDEHRGAGVVAFWAGVPANVICLDFDSVDEGGLSEDWQRWLQGAAIERSASGRGLHAFFRVPEAFAARIRGDRETHTGFPFRWKGAAADAGFAGLDVFCGGVNRVVKVTGDAVNDWQALGSFELCAEGLAMLEREFEAQGWFTGSAAAGAGREARAGVGGLRTEVARLEAEAVERLGAGVEDAAEVLRLMRQNSYGHGVQGFWCRVLDGDAEVIETHCGGWSEADLAALREMTFYSRRAEVLLDAMADCKLTLRGAGYTGSNRNKWARKDYAEATLAAAYRARLEGGQTYQMKQAAKEQVEHQQRETLDALPEALQERLEIGKGGVIRATLNNAVAFLELHPAFGGLLGWNDLTGQAEIVRVPVWSSGRALQTGAVGRDTAGVLLTKLHQTGCKIRRSDLEAAIPAVAERRAFNPIADKLRALVWDGVPRLETMGDRYFCLDERYSEEERRVANVLLAKTLIGAVKRGMAGREARVKHDTMLILMGEAGVRKSTAVRILGTVCGEEFFTDSLPNLKEDPVEFQRGLSGLWFAEAGEMASLVNSKAGEEVLKNVLTVSEDRYRQMYENHSKRQPRVCSIVGTYNPTGDGFITNYALCRRLWAVKVGGAIDTDGLLRDREQLFAEAVRLADEGYTNYLDKPEDMEVQAELIREFYRQNVLVDTVEEVLQRRKEHELRDGFKLQQLFEWAGSNRSEPNPLVVLSGRQSFDAVKGLMADALRQLEYEPHTRSTGRGREKRNYVVWIQRREPEDWSFEGSVLSNAEAVLGVATPA